VVHAGDVRATGPDHRQTSASANADREGQPTPVDRGEPISSFARISDGDADGFYRGSHSGRVAAPRIQMPPASTGRGVELLLLTGTCHGPAAFAAHAILLPSNSSSASRSTGPFHGHSARPRIFLLPRRKNLTAKSQRPQSRNVEAASCALGRGRFTTEAQRHREETKTNDGHKKHKKYGCSDPYYYSANLCATRNGVSRLVEFPRRRVFGVWF
jgi:hypothetical protein